MRKRKGNVPDGANWFYFKDLYTEDGLIFDMYCREANEHGYIPVKLVLSEGQKSVKANFWLSVKATSGDISKGKDVAIMKEYYPSLYLQFVHMIQNDYFFTRHLT